MDMYSREKNTKSGHRYEFIGNGHDFPEWGKVVVGVGDGYEVFEDEKDCEDWMKNTYRKWEKDWIKEQEDIRKREKEEADNRGKIGFFGAA